MRFFLGLMFVVYNGLLYLVDSIRDRIILVFGACLAYAMQHFYAKYCDKKIVRENILKDKVPLWLDAVCSAITDLHRTGPVRANLMLVRDLDLVSRILQKKPYLKMSYYTDDYPPDEIMVEYSKQNMGVCWQAFEHKAQSYFDRETSFVNLCGINSATQTVTRNVKSVLCTPIYKDGATKPTGVLNLDSIEYGIGVTKFHESGVQNTAAQLATRVSNLLFSGASEEVVIPEIEAK